MMSNTTVISSSCASTKAPPLPLELLLAIFDHLSLFGLRVTALVCRNWSIQADRTIWTRHPIPLEVAMRRIKLLRSRRETCQSLPITHIKLRNAILDVRSSQYLKHLKPSYGSALFSNLRQLSIAADRDVNRLLQVLPLSTIESISFQSSRISSLRAIGLLQHLAAWSTLQRLEFVFTLVPFPTLVEAVTLPVLRELSLHVRRHTEALIRAIKAPKLQSIKIYPWKDAGSALDPGSLAYVGEQYPLLEHVTLRLYPRWDSCSVVNSVMSFPQLRSLTLVSRGAVCWNLAGGQFESLAKLSRLEIELPMGRGRGEIPATVTSEVLIKLSRHVPALQELRFSLGLRASSITILEELQPFPLLKTLRLTIWSWMYPQDSRPSWSSVADWLARACPKLTHFEVQLHGWWSDGEGERDPAAVFWEHHKKYWGVEMQGVSPPSFPGWRQLSRSIQRPPVGLLVHTLVVKSACI